MKSKVLKIILSFLLCLIFTLILNPLTFDEIWNYGFTYNIYLGLIPYRDFNMIITPFYPFFMSILFHVFGGNMLIFHIENAVIVTLFILICEKLLKDKWYLILPFLIFPSSLITPNYNFFVLFLFILLIYCEKNNKSDYLIGVLLSIIFLTKQSIGISLLFVSLYYIKSKNKILKRAISFILINSLFLIYLIASKSFSKFIDLCFLGLVDFGNSNTMLFTITFFLTVILLIGVLFLIKNDYKKIDYYYLLMFFSICIPLFDLTHFSIFVMAFIIVFFMNNNIEILNYKLIGILLFICFFVSILEIFILILIVILIN